MANAQIPTDLFHWEAKGLSAGWSKAFMHLIINVPGQSVTARVVHTDGKVTAKAGDETLHILARNEVARGSISERPGGWQIALILLGLGRHYQVSVVDDAGTAVTVRSLKRQTSLGFTEAEFDDFAESLGLINRAMSKAARFAQFI